MTKLVVDAEWLRDRLDNGISCPPLHDSNCEPESSCYDCQLEHFSTSVRPMTPAEERAGDEEWCVVRKDRLIETVKDLYPDHIPPRDSDIEYAMYYLQGLNVYATAPPQQEKEGGAE